MRRQRGLLVVLLLSLLVLVATYLFRYDIHDWLKLREYTPSSEVVALADSTTMTPASRRLFYVNHPQVTDKTEFNQYCRKQEQSIVLGCYISGQNGIYILSVDDERLEGIEQATAAHELLHAAYERLTAGERERVNALLLQVYDDLDGSRIQEAVDAYSDKGDSVVINEMHSIFGTTLRSLPAELEQHYAKYFSDRQKIVGFYEQYEQAFLDRKNKIRDLAAQITALRSEIEIIKDQLTNKHQELSGIRMEIDKLRSEDKFDESNLLVPIHNQKIDEFNALVDTVTGLIAEHNDKLQQLHQIDAEETELIKSIDSRDIIPK